MLKYLFWLLKKKTSNLLIAVLIACLGILCVNLFFGGENKMIITVVQFMLSSAVIILTVLLLWVKKSVEELESEFEHYKDIATRRDDEFRSLELKIRSLYKFKVMFKQKGWFASRKTQEEYFFNKKQVKEFIRSDALEEVVVINLENGEVENIKI